MSKKQKENLHATKQVADNIFRRLFNNAERAVELYELVSGETCSPDEIEICTLPDDSMLSRFNDVTFRVRDRLLFFFEHQSTPCPNMPLRLLRYFTDILYLDVDINKPLYGSKLYTFSEPEFYVLYDGAAPWGKKHLFLSDAFGGSGGRLEMRVDIINAKEISAKQPENTTLLSGFLSCMVRFRELLAAGMYHDVAVRTALDEASKKDTPFGLYVKENYEEVLNMMTLTYNKEDEIAVIKGEVKEEVALNLMHYNIPLDIIMKTTGLTREEIEKLKD